MTSFSGADLIAAALAELNIKHVFGIVSIGIINYDDIVHGMVTIF